MHCNVLLLSSSSSLHQVKVLVLASGLLLMIFAALHIWG